MINALSMQVYHPKEVMTWQNRWRTIGKEPMQTEGWPYILWLGWNKQAGWWRLLDSKGRPQLSFWFRAEVTND